MLLVSLCLTSWVVMFWVLLDENPRRPKHATRAAMAVAPLVVPLLISRAILEWFIDDVLDPLVLRRL